MGTQLSLIPGVAGRVCRGSALALLVLTALACNARNDHTANPGQDVVQAWIEPNGSVRVEILGPDIQFRLHGTADEVIRQMKAADVPKATEWRESGYPETGFSEYPHRLIRTAGTVGVSEFVNVYQDFGDLFRWIWFDVAPVRHVSEPAVTLSFNYLEPKRTAGESWFYGIPRDLDGRVIQGVPHLRIEIPVAPRSADVRYRYRPINAGLLERHGIPGFDVPNDVFENLEKALRAIPESTRGEILFVLTLVHETTFEDFWDFLLGLRRSCAKNAVPLGWYKGTLPSTVEIEVADADGSLGWSDGLGF